MGYIVGFIGEQIYNATNNSDITVLSMIVMVGICVFGPLMLLYKSMDN